METWLAVKITFSKKGDDRGEDNKEGDQEDCCFEWGISITDPWKNRGSNAQLSEYPSEKHLLT